MALVLACFLVIVFITDIRKRKIPNKFTIPSVVIGLTYYTIVDGLAGLKFSLFGCLSGFGLLTVLYLVRAVGAGDVKLFAAIGALAGTSLMLYILFYAIIYSGMIGLIVVLSRRPTIIKLFVHVHSLVSSVVSKEKRVLQEAVSRATRFPFMLAVLPAAITVFVMYGSI